MDRRGFLTALGAAAGVGALTTIPTGCAAPAPPALDPLGPLSGGLPSPTPGRDRWARMPSSFHRLVTREADDVPLQVLGGELPSDLAGHVLFQSLSLLPSDAGFSGDALDLADRPGWPTPGDLPAAADDGPPPVRGRR